MYTKASLMFLYTETSLHIGSGTSLSAVDLPIQREKYTNFPNGAGSGVKGAVREWFEHFEQDENGNWKDGGEMKIDAIFGPEKEGSDHAGSVSFTDLRLLLFPVRSMKGVFAYVTCPFVLSRLKRELNQIVKSVDWQIDLPNEDQAMGTSANAESETENCDLVISNKKVVLEEFSFTCTENENLNKISKWISDNAIPNSPDYDFWKKKIKRSLLLISDDNFKDFVEHSTEIQARIKLGKNKTTSGEDGNLFYEENVPCDTLFYSLVLASKPHLTDPPAEVNTDENVIQYIKKLNTKRLQIGGDETIGKGIVNVKFLG